MHFKDKSVTPIRVGLDQIGIVGLHDALKKADELDPDDRAAIVEGMMEHLGPLNYIPDGQVEAYRTAFWRESQRRRGRDFSAWYSELPVTIRGERGDERDRFVALAQGLGSRASILHCQAPVDVLESRLRARAAAGGDPSEADENVLRWQLERFQPPTAAEPCIPVDMSLPLDAGRLASLTAAVLAEG